MKQLVAFFETDPQMIAQQSFTQRVVLQTLFKNKNLYRYHRDFEYRWRIIFEQALVSDLDHLMHTNEFGLVELYKILQQHKIQHAEATAEGLQNFLESLNYLPFSEIGFCNILINQVKGYSQKKQPELYALIQTFLYYFVQAYLQPDHRLKSQWLSLSSFFVGRSGDLTPLFRAASAYLLYTVSGRSRSSSGGHLKASSIKQSKKFPNNILGLRARFDYERQLLLQTIKNVEKIAHLGFQEHNRVAQPLINYFEKQYHIYVRLHVLPHETLIGLFSEISSDVYWISGYECLPINPANLYDKLLDLYLEEVVSGKILDIFEPDPHTPEHHLFSIGESAQSDNDDSDSDDFDADMSFSRSSSSDSVRLRGSSIDANWSSFGKKWRQKKDSEKLPYLLKGLSERYGWPQDFLTVALSSLSSEALIITERDYYLLTNEQIDFQCKIFEALQRKWDKSSLALLSQPYSPSQVVFPFVENNSHKSSYSNSILSQINKNNLCLTRRTQRYKYLDTACLEALMAVSSWEQNLDSSLVEEAFERSSVVILKLVLSKNRRIVGNWTQFLKKGLFEGSWEFLELLINSPNINLISDDWMLLVSWATEREISCSLQEVNLYMSIEHQFRSLMAREASTEFWTDLLWSQPELFEKRVIFCPQWGYPEQPRSQTFFQTLTIDQKIPLYQSWLFSLYNPNMLFDRFLRLVLTKENDLITQQVVRVFLGQDNTLNELFLSLQAIRALLQEDDEAAACQIYDLIFKVYLHYQPEDHVSIIKFLRGPLQVELFSESILQKLKQIFTPCSAEQLNHQYQKIQRNEPGAVHPVIFSQSLLRQDITTQKRVSTCALHK